MAPSPDGGIYLSDGNDIWYARKGKAVRVTVIGADHLSVDELASSGDGVYVCSYPSNGKAYYLHRDTAYPIEEVDKATQLDISASGPIKEIGWQPPAEDLLEEGE